MLVAGGVDVVNIADGPRAVLRMSNTALGKHLMDTLGIEVLLHVCCRVAISWDCRWISSATTFSATGIWSSSRETRRSSETSRKPPPSSTSTRSVSFASRTA
jgi:hypothetical protein